MIVQIRPAAAFYTINASELSKQIATSGVREIIAVTVTGGSGGAAVRLYNSRNGSGEASPSKDSILISANGGETTCFTPVHPLPFDQGLYIELEQGGSGNGEATVVYN